MRLLLDTHAFLWWATDDPALSRKARAAVAEAEHSVLVSVASLWEMAIKSSLGRLELGGDFARVVPAQLAENGFDTLAIELSHLGRVAALPLHHGDPFDRMLAAQALEDELVLVTRDPVFRRYGVRRLW